MSQTSSDWLRNYNNITLAYNCTYHNAIGSSPFKAVYGFDFKTPLERVNAKNFKDRVKSYDNINKPNININDDVLIRNTVRSKEDPLFETPASVIAKDKYD